MGRPRTVHEPRVGKRLRLPAGLYERAQTIADERQVPFVQVLTWAIEEFLERIDTEETTDGT